MEVRKRHNPESELGPAYAHDLYEFEVSGVKYVARSYLSEPEGAHFLRREAHGQMRALTPEDLQSKAFHEAVGYLRKHGKAHVQYLSFAAEGYVDVPC